MNISKKYIKESFKKRGIQINEDAVSSIEFKLKILLSNMLLWQKIENLKELLQ